MRIAAAVAASLLLAIPSPAASPTPAQSQRQFLSWLARSGIRGAEFRAFASFLRSAGVANVIPAWQLVRTASDHERCSAPGFEVAPRVLWPNIVRTLRFARDAVVPTVGPLEAVSSYRNVYLNGCSGGAPRSAHRLFFALDLQPRSGIARHDLIRRVCAQHARFGAPADVGLGFYQGTRFHLDSKGYRKWGSDGKGASSPCNS